MQGNEMHVPGLWAWEILNAVGVAIKRKRITADRGRDFLEQLAKLNFRMDRPVPVAEFPRLHSLAAKYQLTAYDVAYLDLAVRLSLPLATRDECAQSRSDGRRCRGPSLIMPYNPRDPRLTARPTSPAGAKAGLE